MGRNGCNKSFSLTHIIYCYIIKGGVFLVRNYMGGVPYNDINNLVGRNEKAQLRDDLDFYLECRHKIAKSRVAFYEE